MIRWHALVRSAFVAAAVALAFSMASSPVMGQDGEAGKETLYAQIGGYDFLARFVDTAFPRVAADPRLQRFFRGHSTDSQIRQRQLIIDALCSATGGPCMYIGRDLTNVHQGLGITADDWTAFMEIIRDTLTELKLDPGLLEEFVQMFELRLRATVVHR